MLSNSLPSVPQLHEGKEAVMASPSRRASMTLLGNATILLTSKLERCAVPSLPCKRDTVKRKDADPPCFPPEAKRQRTQGVGCPMASESGSMVPLAPAITKQRIAIEEVTKGFTLFYSDIHKISLEEAHELCFSPKAKTVPDIVVVTAFLYMVAKQGTGAPGALIAWGDLKLARERASCVPFTAQYATDLAAEVHRWNDGEKFDQRAKPIAALLEYTQKYFARQTPHFGKPGPLLSCPVDRFFKQDDSPRCPDKYTWDNFGQEFNIPASTLAKAKSMEGLPLGYDLDVLDTADWAAAGFREAEYVTFIGKHKLLVEAIASGRFKKSSYVPIMSPFLTLGPSQTLARFAIPPGLCGRLVAMGFSLDDPEGMKGLSSRAWMMAKITPIERKLVLRLQERLAGTVPRLWLPPF